MRNVAMTMLIVCMASFAVAAERSDPSAGPDRFTQPGLPTISYDFDAESRLTGVLVDGRLVVQYDWSAEALPTVRFVDRWTIRTELLDPHTILQETFDFKGDRVRMAAPSLEGRRYARLPVVLDVVAEELGLPASWRDSLRYTGPDRAAIAQEGGDLDIQMHTISPGRQIGSIDGMPAFWDLDLPVDFGGGLAGVLPTRLVVTQTGSLQLSSPRPLYDAVESLWTGPAGSNAAQARFVTDRRTNQRLGSELLWVCGYTERWNCTSSGSTGYCENYYEPYYCDSGGGGGGSYEPPPTGGGTTTDPALTAIKKEYNDYCGYTPATSEFSTSSTYQRGALHQFSFSDLKSPESPYAIITDELKDGLAAMILELDNQTPRLTDAYRTPSERPAGSAGCGGHTRGTAVDISIRNASGAFDCNMWNYMAAAANASGGWVESWADTIAGGTPHLHVDFGRAANTPQEYGTCSGY
jgi:hypothetical protein